MTLEKFILWLAARNATFDVRRLLPSKSIELTVRFNRGDDHLSNTKRVDLLAVHHGFAGNYLAQIVAEIEDAERAASRPKDESIQTGIIGNGCEPG